VRLRDTEKRLHQGLFLVVPGVLQSDYRHHANAAQFVKFAMDVAAAISLSAIKNWDSNDTSLERLERELKALLQ
jgi:hypothetical protein